MYKLYPKSNLSNLKETISITSEDTKYYAKNFACFFAAELTGIVALYNINILYSLPQVMTAGVGLAAFFHLKYLATKALKNFNDNREAWRELGKQMNIEEARKLSNFQSPEQLQEIQIKKEFIKDDKVIPFDLFATTSDTAGGRTEDLGGRQKILNKPN